MNQNNAKLGTMEAPLPATRVLVKRLDPTKFSGKESFALLAINDVEGTYTSVNVYGGNVGKHYDPQHYTYTLPAQGSEKWKKWNKEYEVGNVGDFDVLELIEQEVKVA